MGCGARDCRHEYKAEGLLLLLLGPAAAKGLLAGWPVSVAWLCWLFQQGVRAHRAQEGCWCGVGEPVALSQGFLSGYRAMGQGRWQAPHGMQGSWVQLQGVQEARYSGVLKPSSQHLTYRCCFRPATQTQ